MSDAFRVKVTKTLTEEIGLLSGGNFEQFCYQIMNIIYPGDWQQRGTTLEGAPRGHTVDISAEGATLVAEVSSQSDYFSGTMDKPKEDLEKALKAHDNATHIWLLSSREESASETTTAANVVAEFKIQHSSLEHLEIVDARKIADYIYNNLEYDNIVNDLECYLPSIGRLSDENAFSHKIPSYPDYQARPDYEQGIIKQLHGSSYVIVTGISGIGKSALVAHVVEKLRPDYNSTIWHDARNLNTFSELSDLDVRRNGKHRNIIGLIRQSKCLLILDDLNVSPLQFIATDCGDSKIIITSQIRDDATPAIVLEDLDSKSSRIILEKDVNVPCPENIFERVFNNIGGYPLLLAILNRQAKDEGWESVSQCCNEAVDSLEDENRQKICQRILSHHRRSLSKELEFVKWCGTSSFDPKLAEICVSFKAVDNLSKRGFLSATTSGMIRIHDIVYKSICAEIEETKECRNRFADKLKIYIRKENRSNSRDLRRVVNLHSQLFGRLQQSCPCPEFVYVIALARTNDTPLELFGTPQVTANIILAYQDWNAREIEIYSLIESIEAIYSIMLSRQGSEAAKKALESNITALKILAENSKATGDLLRDLKHHYAKMLIRLEKYNDAETIFKEILVNYPEFNASRLQLVRILVRNKDTKKEAYSECRKIISQKENHEGEVSTPIVLEALHIIAKANKLNTLEGHEEIIMNTLSNVREIDDALASRLVSLVAQKLWYNMPEFVSRMYDSIEWRDIVPASDSEYFDWAQSHKAAAKASKDNSSRKDELLKAAIDSYSKIGTPNHYHKVQHAEALILSEKYTEANNLLDSVCETHHNEHWWQRKSQALLGLDNPVAALTAIDNALEKVSDEKYTSAFLHDRYKAKRQLTELTAIDDLMEAIKLLPPNDKYRYELQRELEDIQPK